MYELLAKFAQTGGLILFVGAFIMVLIYALAPSNAARFDKARRAALEDLPPAGEEARHGSA
jgi:cytochrome c oxidase cbb3-type subunit 4